jgi:hypothetical protein
VLIVKLRENRSNSHTSDGADGEARGTYAAERVPLVHSQQECKRRLAAAR